MDEEAVERVKAFVERLEDRITFEHVYLFGSRARDDYDEDSDIDLVIVSPDFEGEPPQKRAKLFYKEWEYPPDIEVKCYTPDEFDRLRQQLSLARTAAESGIAIA